MNKPYEVGGHSTWKESGPIVKDTMKCVFHIVFKGEEVFEADALNHDEVSQIVELLNEAFVKGKESVTEREGQ